MACTIVSTTSAVFALWGDPTPSDMDSLTDTVENAARSSGQPVLYVARVPADAAAPDAEARGRLHALIPRLLPCLSTAHLVMEGDGFSAAVKRGVLTGIIQLAWRRDTFFVHSSVADVRKHVPAKARDALEALLMAAREKGLLDPNV
jgi:hypothetical protein